MGRTRKGPHASLGLSLTKKNKPGWDRKNDTNRHTEDPTSALKSVTEETSYDEFIATATLAHKDFTAEKLNVKFVSLSTADPITEGEAVLTEEDMKKIVVPRRPKWTTEMSAEELDLAEREAFLNWRRSMAQLQEKEGITPFERNIEVWRQLWRVVERADIVVQIVDARNPLLYRCEDLERYVKELGSEKQNVLLINKADYLTDLQRSLWSQFFKSIDLPHAFYSATIAAETLKDIPEDNVPTDSDSSSDTEEAPETEKGKPETESGDQKNSILSDNEERYSTNILDRKELTKFLLSFKSPDSDLLNVGLVGYPNVGKSSTINSLMAVKKTSVSATPGKTKHFQTLFLQDDILLCDCPGLVMPAFGGSKGEMLLGGILPIDQLTNYVPSMSILATRFPKSVLEQKYGVTLPPNFTYDDFLNAYASIRGFMTVRGIPDCSRASRIILKDYVTGRLCYCHAPLDISQDQFQPQYAIKEESRLIPDDEGQRPIEVKQKPTTIKQPNLERKLDCQFFAPNLSSVHFKGKQVIPSGLSSSNDSTGVDKPWKRHNNQNKREKLRRLYRHLDVE